MSQDIGLPWRDDDLTTALDTQQHEATSLEALDQRLMQNPADVASWRRRGSILIALHRYDEALETFAHALSLDADDAWIWANYADMLEKLQRADEALEAYRRATT